MTRLTDRFSSLDRERGAPSCDPTSSGPRRIQRRLLLPGQTGLRWPEAAFRMRCAACPMDTHRAARRAYPESRLGPSNESLLATLGITGCQGTVSVPYDPAISRQSAWLPIEEIQW